MMEIIAIILCIVVLGSPFIAFEIYKRKINIFNRNTMSFKESIDLTNLPIVTFNIGNNKYNFLLDSGATASVINTSVLNTIEYTKTDIKSEVFGMEGNVQEIPVVEVWLNYKDKTFKEAFQVINMNAAFGLVKQEHGVTIHGILGSNFFVKYKYILNFSELIAYNV